MRYAFLFVFVFFTFSVRAQIGLEMSLEDGLTEAILDMTTTPRRHLRWRPCGERLDREGKEEKAREFARVIIENSEGLDPWMMSAQIMQESGFNPCITSRHREIRRRFQTAHPTRNQVVSFIRSWTRQGRRIDAGIAQYRWPGVAARRQGADSPSDLLDADFSISAFANSLRSFKSTCGEEDRIISVIDHYERDGTLHVRRREYRCSDVYWAIHNTGNPDRVRTRYINNVRRRYRVGPERWRALVESQDNGGSS